VQAESVAQQGCDLVMHPEAQCRDIYRQPSCLSIQQAVAVRY